MNRTQLLRRASKAGFGRIAPHILYYCLNAGYVDEPPRGANGNAVYSQHHLDQLIAYVEARRPRIAEPALTE